VWIASIGVLLYIECISSANDS